MKHILVISSFRIEKEILFQYIQDLDLSHFGVIQVGSIAEAEDILVTSGVSLIIIEWDLEEAAVFTCALKSDEMFKLMPVVAIVSDLSRDQIKEIIMNGVDNYVLRQEFQEQLPVTIRPLLLNNVMNEELVSKISELQEQAIHDFILLDLIKKYIPQTIWDLANNYAYEQKIHIPEEELELTIAFGDIKEFTRMSQHLEPIQVVRNLNVVFEIVTRIIYEHHGDIDKFIGDAFLAVFEHPRDAVIAMVKVQQEIAYLNQNRQEQDLPQILFRIGIHTGPIIRGNVGGNGRYDNTLIGDTVNTASRLENLSRAGDILISETTRKKAGLDIHPENRFRVKLKGKDSEEEVYQVYELLKDVY